jgi:hypothetical protein
MWRDSAVRRLVAILICGAFLIQTSGCMGWSTQQKPPAQVLTEKSYDRARVTSNDGRRVEVYQPRVVGDTLVGFTSQPSEKKEPKAIAIPVSDIRYVEVQKVSAGKTILLAAGIGLTVLLIAAASSLSDWGDWGNGGDTTTSCPLIYSWDGKNWRLESGTFGGAVMPALERTDIDNLLHAVPAAGVLRLRLANVLRETDYVDGFSVLAVDHPKGVVVLPDAAGGLTLHTVRQPVAPLVARDDRGRDVLSRIGVSDGIGWESALLERDPAAPSDQRDGLELLFRRPAGRDSVTLVLDAQNTPWAAHLMQRLAGAFGRDVMEWYDAATTDSAARVVGPIVDRDAALQVKLYLNGSWETRGYVREIGPETAKQVALSLNLDRVPGDTVRIRLESIPNLWRVDFAGLDASPAAALTVQGLALDRADHNGADVRNQLRDEDHDYMVLENGEAVQLVVTAPPVPQGLARSYLARTTGWYRLHTDETLQPDVTFLEALSREGPSAVAIRLTNQALQALR